MCFKGDMSSKCACVGYQCTFREVTDFSLLKTLTLQLNLSRFSSQRTFKTRPGALTFERTLNY